MADKTPEQLVAEAEAPTKKLIANSGSIRDYYNEGRPNKSKESTVLGSLKALDMLLAGWSSPGAEQKIAEP